MTVSVPLGHVLITGATGFLGGAVAASLMRGPQLGSLLFTSRADSAAEGLARLRRNLARFTVPLHLLARLNERQLILGDLARSTAMLGDPRLDTVSHAINCAAITSFSPHPRMRATNVDGPAALARRLAAVPGFARLVHVGTAMACGERASGVVSERRYEPEETRHVVDYTRSKLEGERAVAEAMPDGRLIVVRPSIVVGHTTLGCLPSGSIFWNLRIAQAMGGVPFALEQKIDVVPVDYAAEALLHLAFAPRPAHQLYHISAGPQGSDDYHSILREMDRAAGHRPAVYRQLTWPEIMQRRPDFPHLFGGGQSRLILKAIRLYAAFASLGITFDNRRLLAEGMPAAPRLTDYIGACVRTLSCGDVYAHILFDHSASTERPVVAPVPAPAMSRRA